MEEITAEGIILFQEKYLLSVGTFSRQLLNDDFHQFSVSLFICYILIYRLFLGKYHFQETSSFLFQHSNFHVSNQVSK